MFRCFVLSILAVVAIADDERVMARLLIQKVINLRPLNYCNIILFIFQVTTTEPVVIGKPFDISYTVYNTGDR